MEPYNSLIYLTSLGHKCESFSNKNNYKNLTNKTILVENKQNREVTCIHNLGSDTCHGLLRGGYDFFFLHIVIE